MIRNNGYLNHASGSPFAAAGGVIVKVADQREPYAILDDLMSVVEVFCPIWPTRREFPSNITFLM